MQTLPTRTPALLALAVAIALGTGACASSPRQSLPLESARSAVSSAHGDPLVAGDARADLVRADSALAAGDALLARRRPASEVEHQAMLADRYARAAQQHGQLLASEAAIARLGERRNAVLLGAREADARRANALAADMTLQATAARADAGNARIDAGNARMDAAAANARSGDLAQQLADLQGQQTDRGMVVTLGDVLFATGMSDLTAGSQVAMGRLTTFLAANPERQVRIEGFTDSVGSDAYNLGLSDRRAAAVTQALTRGGIDAGRIDTQGYGEGYPLATNATLIGRQQNRRVEVIISAGDQPVTARTR